MSERVIVTVVIQLVYDPKMDDDEDIKERIHGEMNTLLNRGHLEGCEHGAQIQSQCHEVLITRIG